MGFEPTQFGSRVHTLNHEQGSTNIYSSSTKLLKGEKTKVQSRVQYVLISVKKGKEGSMHIWLSFIKYFQKLKTVTASKAGKWWAKGLGQDTDFYLLYCETCNYWFKRKKKSSKILLSTRLKLKLGTINTNTLLISDRCFRIKNTHQSSLRNWKVKKWMRNDWIMLLFENKTKLEPLKSVFKKNYKRQILTGNYVKKESQLKLFKRQDYITDNHSLSSYKD